MPSQTPLQTGWDMTEPGTALSSFLDTLPVKPQLLALGEPTHGLDIFPAWRNRIFHTLVQEHGFRSVAIESDVIAGLRVNAYVMSGEETLDEVMRCGFSHGFGAVAANRELIRWMRDFNVGRADSDQVSFYGFDAPLENLWAASPRASLLALHAFLSRHLGALPVGSATLERLCGEDTRWTDPAAAMDPSKSIGDSGEARQLRLLADDLLIRLRTEMPYLALQRGFWEAQLHARTATGLLRYHAVIADPAPDRVARMLALRDLMMADNLSAIARREQKRGPTLVFAHNTHLQRNLSVMKMGGQSLEWWSAGAHISLQLGNQYAFVASVLGTVPERANEDPDTLMNFTGPASLVTAQALNAGLPGQQATGTDNPVQARSLLLEGHSLVLTDGVLFVKKTAT